MRSDANISADGVYRYTLLREWGIGPVMVFLGLNPSTADAVADDPTIRREIGFAKAAGCGALWKWNLYALRSTDPAALLTNIDPVGPKNDDWLRIIFLTATPETLVVAAWGAWGDRFTVAPRVRAVQAEAAKAGVTLHALGTTKSGQPRHSLYLPKTATLAPWPANPPKETP